MSPDAGATPPASAEVSVNASAVSSFSISSLVA
jgi:hypothetical protein